MTKQDEIGAALKAWRDGLVGLTRQSSHIKFRASKSSSLLIDTPEPDLVLAGLRSGRPQVFQGDWDPADGEEPNPLAPGSSFHTPRPDKEVRTVVRNLMRRSNAVFLDRGLSVLYMAFGMLYWRDTDDSEMISPLLLVPVQLIPEGPMGTPRVTESDDDPVLNPALTLRLKEFGIELPSADDFEGQSVTETLAEIHSALEESKTFKGWKLVESTHLSTFSFAKEAMFKDLLDNEDRVLGHPIVRALATSDPSKQSRVFQFDPISPDDVDRLAPPETTPLVLDADSSQRIAVAAALSGKTFVMDGPPGTGKSQTIANMVGALLHAGKTVLFVSEKMAALDVVRNRLSDAGLGSYLMELHSHKASRKEVATELLKTLDSVTKPPLGMPALSRKSAEKRRDQLNQYAQAMNEIRVPLNVSLHDALGRYAVLSTAPIAPVPEAGMAELSESDYLGIQESLSKIIRAWRPAIQGNSFLWRQVTDERSLEVRLYQAESALEELHGTAALVTDLAESFNLSKLTDIPQLSAIIEHQNYNRPKNVMESWLTADSTKSLTATRDELALRIAALDAAESEVVRAAGVPWMAFPELTSVPAVSEMRDTSPSPLDLRSALASDLNTVANRFESDAKLLDELQDSLSALASNIGLPQISSFGDVHILGTLIDLRSQNTRPDRRWFSPTGITEARSVANSLRKLSLTLKEAEERASQTFNPAVLQAPLADLQNRFTNLHRGLKKLSKSYRTDKKTVAGLLANAGEVKNGIKHISDAIEWDEASKAFNALGAAKGGVLGTHWLARESDFDSLNAAFNAVDEVIHLTNGNVPQALVAYMTGIDSNDAYQNLIDTARADIGRWKLSLHPSPALAGRPELVLQPVSNVIKWLQTHVDPMRQVAARIVAVEKVTNNKHTLCEANALLALAENAKKASNSLQTDAPSYQAMFGEYFDYGHTDLQTIDEAIEWSATLRALCQGPLTAEQVELLAESDSLDSLAPTYEKWARARERIMDAFAPERHAELMSELDDYSDAVAFMDDLRKDTVGQQEWFDFQNAYADLAKWDLNTAIDFCVEQRLAEHDVKPVVNRALLRSWCDFVIQRDSRLRPMRAMEREALVNEFRSLDRDILKTATADIIRAANTRRPVNTTMGESGVIRREGGKQKRHRPVRELMASTRNVTPSIKPVFMMSPLAVSQYLPPDMEFDVVIFDEASQVSPGDAINCIYRGKSLILAGDDKQLPPTSFFERSPGDDDDEYTDVKDFQSVLELAKASGAFNNLGLRWHYRSRHEDLIAFSNYKFYEGKLVTFPSAHVDGSDVGVEFFHAHGMYRRGGGAFNPIEATMVAERVIEHFSNRPQLTLGVVTFSVAQADAVQNAIDEARINRRDLDHYFDSDDRLDGFFIRALEQVQGDERDVIIFSVGYGPDEAGKLSSNFGALNRDKGWRRLNVGITRARQRVEVVASMHAGQIPPSTNENVEYFRAYLDYAEQGPQTLAIPYSSTGMDPESPFEESVLSAIKSWGYIVEPQVGAAGFRIDLGVRHPAYTGMFAIGIECDGYQYHSAPAARDRDRLRDQILNGLGWRLHRIWGTAWYRDRATEETRLRAAINDAIETPLSERMRKVHAIERPVVETEPADMMAAPTWTAPYQLAPAHMLPHWVDPGAAGSHRHMTKAIEALVENETPIHLEIVYERLRDWWSIGRIGSNIRYNIDLAINRSQVDRDGDFLLLPESGISHVRTPTAEVSRKVEQIHGDEIALAILMTIRDVGSASRSEVAQGVSRIFGWNRMGNVVGRRINEVIDDLVDRGEVITVDESLALARTS